MSRAQSRLSQEEMQIKAELKHLMTEAKDQLKQRLNHLVEAHENDRKALLDLFLVKTSLTYSGDFQTLKGQLENEFECYVQSVRYCQGKSSGISFTSEPITAPQDEAASWFSKLNTGLLLEEALRPEELGLADGRSTLDNEPSRIASVIKTSVATRTLQQRPSWAFSYDLGFGRDYYILICPNASSGCGFAFSNEPFLTGLAAEHFKKCGVAFQDDADIVRRFARRRRLTRDLNSHIALS
ncbi:hypothetical protein CTAM01_16506 [Colletotrichum tamarilloi]|uniref:Uncharacterized protein n=1 Tax=Colletotrichum tamarilloi TaxID=1209934 RepID=A0ABQ9QIC0_9PEZI|nr:uncharacterized protein CTAM01_16506 [Colletotrichum tamarilloi]KAK1471615.1 hypothetical protein CTAM01_16506 [Colletotrichum tamarilloi]